MSVEVAPRACAFAVGLLLGASAIVTAAAQAAPPLPAPLEAFLANVVHPSAAERKTLLGGTPIAKLLPGDVTKDVAVAGAVWIAAAPGAYVAKVKDIERFETGGGFKITKRISDPARIEDFADLHLTDDDFRDLRKCRIGECEVKLDAQWIERFRTGVPWGTPGARAAADMLFRRHALERVVEYRQGGNNRLPVYNDRETPVAEATELRGLIESAPTLLAMPDLQRFLFEYPKVSLERSSEMFYWQEVTFGLKRTFRITHLVIQDRGGATAVASKMLYASHYFWAALEMRLLLPDEARGRGFWFLTTNRSRIDGLTGFVGRLIRGHVRSEAQRGALNMMSSAKTVVEGKAR